MVTSVNLAKYPSFGVLLAPCLHSFVTLTLPLIIAWGGGHQHTYIDRIITRVAISLLKALRVEMSDMWKCKAFFLSLNRSRGNISDAV